MLKTILPDENATLALGAAIARGIEPGLVVFLHGDLGAGKTTLVRGVLRGLGFEGRVKSPTYALVEVYEVSRLDFHHFDFYRFQDPRECNEAGFRDTFDGRRVSFVEWPEKAHGLLPTADVEVSLAIQDAGRVATLKANTEAGWRSLEATMHAGSDPSRTSR